jgi:hypothetical protein
LELGRSRIGVVAAVVAVAGGILVLAGGQGSGTSAPPPPHHDRQSAPLPDQGMFVVDTVQRHVRTAPLPKAVGLSDVGGGFAWLASADGVLQANQRTGAVVDTVPVKGGTTAVVYADGKLWATPRTASSPSIRTLLEIDPTSHHIRSIAVPGSYDSIIRGGGYIWVPGSNRIDRVNAATGRLEGGVHFALGPPNFICAKTFAYGRLWLATAGARYAGQLVQVDPRSLRVLHHTTIPDRGDSQYCVTAGAGSIWADSPQGYNIYAFDPRRARLTARLQIGRVSWMAGARDALWFSTNKDPALLQAVNGDGTPVERVRLPVAPLGFYVAGSLLYAGFGVPLSSE